MQVNFKAWQLQMTKVKRVNTYDISTVSTCILGYWICYVHNVQDDVGEFVVLQAWEERTKKLILEESYNMQSINNWDNLSILTIYFDCENKLYCANSAQLSYL